MKEKRVDIYLARANFSQMLFLALGGGAIPELLNGNSTLAFIGGGLAILEYISIKQYYKKAETLSQKKKLKNRDYVI